MRVPINRIVIKNYKSLEDLSLDLKRFMVFIGPNNAGKSNLFDSLSFLSDLVKSDLGVIRGRGGFEQIVFNGEIDRVISFEIFGEMDIDRESRRYKYLIELEGDRFGGCFNRKELFLLLQDDEWRKLLEFPTDQGTAVAWDEAGKQTGKIGAGRDRSYLSFFRDERLYPPLSLFSKEVQSWAFFNFLPPLMRSPSPVRKEIQVQRWGENLSVVLHALQTEHPRRFAEVEDILKTIIPEVKELSTGLTEHETSQTYVRLHEKSLKIPIPAWEMSDGTLHLLAYLAVLLSPDPPPLMCFEEPENYVHPRLLELIVDLLKGVSERAQVLVTTHSPYLVDHLELEDLAIVEKKEGRTQVKIIEDKETMREVLEALTLGEIWFSGSIGGVP
ncbi:TPA: DUF2813 domain-containing protein [Candidatus Poribacteria bacterium]|nr:DUF2813 domain-containing protein [Candidatus Poribacteria bacterium]HEX29281.1 DUF2813 domain-containing protein [Candidatus Poribacteria bacterium]